MIPNLNASLLHGAFICSSTDPVAFNQLRDDPEQRNATDEWLHAAGFSLACTSSGSAYYACTLFPNTRDHAADILVQFKSAYVAGHQTRAILRMIATTAGTLFEFKPGELLRGGELFLAIDSSETHKDCLRKLWSKLGRKAKDPSDYDMTLQLLEALELDGYLAREPGSNPNFRVCGKIEHAFDLISFASQIAGYEAPLGADEKSTEDAIPSADPHQLGASTVFPETPPAQEHLHG